MQDLAKLVDLAINRGEGGGMWSMMQKYRIYACKNLAKLIVPAFYEGSGLIQ